MMKFLTQATACFKIVIHQVILYKMEEFRTLTFGCLAG